MSNVHSNTNAAAAAAVAQPDALYQEDFEVRRGEAP
jgi:hypothetical protein